MDRKHPGVVGCFSRLHRVTADAVRGLAPLSWRASHGSGFPSALSFMRGEFQASRGLASLLVVWWPGQ